MALPLSNRLGIVVYAAAAAICVYFMLPHFVVYCFVYILISVLYNFVVVVVVDYFVLSDKFNL